MATFKFFNIGKANEEIARLEGELAAQALALQTLTANSAAVEERATQLSTDLATAQASVASLGASLAAKDSEISNQQSAISNLKSELANPGAQIISLASVKAGEITAAQGIPPVAIAATSGNPAGKPEPKTFAEQAIAAAQAKAQARAQ